MLSEPDNRLKLPLETSLLNIQLTMGEITLKEIVEESVLPNEKSWVSVSKRETTRKEKPVSIDIDSNKQLGIVDACI